MRLQPNRGMGVPIILNRVLREMRNFHGVFGLGEFPGIGGDAVYNLYFLNP